MDVRNVDGYAGGNMRLNFYDTRLSENGRTVLVKEKGINYGTGSADRPENITRLMKDVLDMDRLAEEHCYMIALNGACEIIGVFFVSKGKADTGIMNTREIYMRALLIGAVMIVICHNHPSGRVKPSSTDIDTTIKIKQAGGLVGIPLIDHIIIGSDGYYSFAENGIL